MMQLVWEWQATPNGEHVTYILDPDHPIFAANVRNMTPMCRRVLHAYLREVDREVNRVILAGSDAE